MSDRKSRESNESERQYKIPFGHDKQNDNKSLPSNKESTGDGLKNHSRVGSSVYRGLKIDQGEPSIDKVHSSGISTEGNRYNNSLRDSNDAENRSEFYSRNSMSNQEYVIDITPSNDFNNPGSLLQRSNSALTRGNGRAFNSGRNAEGFSNGAHHTETNRNDQQGNNFVIPRTSRNTYLNEDNSVIPENEDNENDPNGNNNPGPSGTANGENEQSDDNENSDETEEEANAPCSWPLSVFKVARSERPKFFRMAGMFFLIAYVYSVLRDTKDAVVMERQEPASIAFLKTLYVTPLSFVAVFALQKLLATYSVGAVLKGATIVFGTYFGVYAGILLPLQERIEPSVFWAKGVFGDGKMAVRSLQPVLALFLTVNFWTSSLLYVTSELWGNVVLALLFMAFANDVCSFRQSLRFVPLFYIVSNAGLFLSGCSMLGLCAIQKGASYTAKRLAVNAVFAMGGSACAGILALHRSLDKVLATSARRVRARPRERRRKVGLAEGLKAMAKSPLLLRACSVVLAYNACTNLVDTAFKSAMKAHAVAENEAVAAAVMRTQAINQIAISAAVIALLLTPFARAVQLVGWRTAGLITPAWAGICGAIVLLLAAYNTAAAGSNHFSLANAVLSDAGDLLWAERLVGMVAAGGLKTAKYAAFDIALEAFSMRIQKDERATAKSVYAGVCGKLGKTFGSILTISTLAATNAIDIRSAAQYCLVALMIMCTAWIYAVGYLANAYNESVTTGKEMEIGITVAKKSIDKKIAKVEQQDNVKEKAIEIKS